MEFSEDGGREHGSSEGMRTVVEVDERLGKMVTVMPMKGKRDGREDDGGGVWSGKGWR